MRRFNVRQLLDSLSLPGAICLSSVLVGAIRLPAQVLVLNPEEWLMRFTTLHGKGHHQSGLYLTREASA